MKDTGIIRNLDSLGRIVIPSGIRERLGINTNDQVEFIIDNEKIVMKKSNYKLEENKTNKNNITWI